MTAAEKEVIKYNLIEDRKRILMEINRLEKTLEFLTPVEHYSACRPIMQDLLDQQRVRLKQIDLAEMLTEERPTKEESL